MIVAEKQEDDGEEIGEMEAYLRATCGAREV